MTKKTFSYSGILLLSLVLISVLLNRDVVQGVANNAAVSLATGQSTHILGETVVFSGTLTFSAAEEDSITGVTLVNSSGPQSFSVDLPLEDTNGHSLADADGFVDISTEASITSTVLAKVTFTDVTNTGGTLPSTLASTLASTLPGTLPTVELVSQGNFLAGSGGGTIAYEIKWTPPVGLDPIPDLVLIPNFDAYYDIPTLSPPSEASGTKVPNTDLAWAVPTAGQVTGTELPNVTSTLGIPQITLSTNAPSYAPDLPATTATSTAGFSVPSQTAATSSAATFPLVSDMFAIPTVPVSTSSVASFGTGVTEQFMVPKPLDGSTTTAQIIKGMTHDGTDFWFIVAGASNDVLIKVTGSTASRALTASSTLPSNDFEGIAYSGGSLWIAEAGHRCYDTIENSMSDGGCNYNTRIYKVDGSDLPPNADGGGTTDATWMQTSSGTATKVAAIYHFGEEWDEYKGITAGDSGTLWIIDGNGNRFRNINATGIELSDYEGEWTQSDSLSFNKNLLYTSNGSTLTQWTDQGKKVTDFDTGKSAIKANAFDSDVLYFASNGDGKVWATFVGETVNQDQPKGITYSSSGSETALWIALNASPKDKILKLNDSTGALITNFSTDGIHDAPSSGVEGITYLGGAIYVIANEGSGWETDRKLYKINVVSGATESGYPKDLSNFVYDDLGGLTNDGTNLVSWTKTNFNDVKVFDTSGQEISSYWPCCPNFNGSKGLAYHSGREEYFITSGTSIQQFDSQFNSGNENTLTLSGSGTAFADSQGATFGGDNLYAVSGARVYQSFLAASVTTKPLGIAWSASTVAGMGNSESVWLLVDAAPYDKIMRVDTDDSTLNTSFDTDGIADAPSGATEGLVFVSEGNDNYLYIVANDTGGDQWNKQKNLYKYNVKTGVVVSGYPKNLENSGVWDELGGITYNGTNLIVTAKTNQGVWIVDTDGNKVSEGWPCCSSMFGMTAAAFHESRELLYAANQGTLVNVSTDLMSISSEQNLTADGSTISGIQGMTFGQDMLYVARYEGNTGYVTAGALKESLTTKPQAMVISPSGAIYQGQNIGQALWVVVDGSPNDRVLKLSIATAGTTTLDTNFGSDSTKNGSASLPAGNIKGIAFLDNYLYVVGDSGYDPHLYKLNPTDGSVENTYPLCGGMGPMPGMGGGGGGGMQVCDSVGGMAQNDTQMILFGEMSDNVWWVDTSGNVQQDTWLQSTGGTSGASAVGYITSTNSYLSGNGSQVQTWMNPFGNDIFPAGNPVTVTGVQNIQALAIKSATKEIYIGWHDGTNGFTSVAVPPSPISNTPLDLAYNANDNELYILVDGNGGDVVVAVNPSTGAILTDSGGAQRYGTVNSEDAFAVAYHDGSVYVAYQERGGGYGGPPPVVASKRSTSTLAETSLVNLQSDCGQVRGLDSDGESLLATVEFCGPKVETINPNNGMQIRDIYFWTSGGSQWMDEGFEDVAYSTTTPTYFVIKSGSLWRIDESGEIIDEWTVNDPDGNPTNQLTGIDFVQTTTGQVLYIADANSEKVYTALIPLPTTSITNKPRAMANDGTNLWVAVDADPVDKILQLTANTSTATLVKSFDSPGTETDGLALLDGELWVLNNDTHNIEQPGGGVMQMTVSTVARLSTTTGEELFFSPIIVNTPYGPDILKDLVSGLATDGDKLYTGSNGDRAQEPGRLYVIDPTNFQNLCMFGLCFNAPVIEYANQFAGALPMVQSFQGFEIASAGTFEDDRRLVTAGSSNMGSPANLISRLDISAFQTYQGNNYADSVMYDQKTLAQQSTAQGYPLTNPIDVKGIAIIGTTLYMADYANGKLLGTTLAENTGVEMTIVGSYTSGLQVVANAGTLTGSASYSIGRNSTVEVQLTSPGPNFVATGTVATIAGRISDPAVTTVSVGIQLPSTEFISDDVNDTGASQALWTSSTLVGDGSVGWNVNTSSFCPDCGGGAWRFGKPAAGSFDQPNSQVKGALMSVDNVPVNMGTMLSFATAWDTEFQPEMDQKFIQVAQITQDLQGNDVVGTWKNIAQVVQFVDPMWMPDPVNPHELLFQWIEAPPLPFAQGQKHNRTIDLSPLAGDTIKVRFLFDSVDEFANEGGGWFVDDIVVSGSGTKTISVPTVMMSSVATTTIGTSTVNMYRSFSTAFTLSEGENTLIATGIQPYSPNLRGQTQVQGFVDTIDPVITLSNVPANTNNPQQQLKGTLVEPTIDKGGMLEISHNVTSPDGSTSTAIVGKVTTEGEFQVFVSLQEGTNTFVAYAEDGGGRNSTKTLVSVADFSPPVAQVGIIGVTSAGEALVGDQYFVVVAAVDTLSGVSTSTLQSTGAAMPAVADVPSILVQMHSLDQIGTTTATHVTLATVQPNTPVAVQDVYVEVTDKAGNSTVVAGSLNVVSSRTNRNYYLFPGNNFMGLAIIPDDDDANTTDDASMDRLMAQDVTDRVSAAYKTYLNTTTVTLADVVASTFAFNKAGNFVVHTPGPAADTLTELAPFQGMNINTNETVDSTEVFKKVGVAGFSGLQSVPIRINIEGVFFRLNELPPGKEMRVGYNLIAPHILSDTLFDTVYRGALVPRELAVSALTFDRRVAASMSSGAITAEIVEGFLTNSIGDSLKPELSYWTFIASDPLDSRVNDLDDPLGPTITP